MAKKKLVHDDEELPNNSHAAKIAPIREDRIEREIAPFEEREAPRRPRRVRAVQKKRTFTQTIAEALIGGGSNNVGGYILHDVLLPAAKSTIQDMVTSGIEMLLFGETSGRSRKNRGGSDRTRISYNSYYRGDDDRRERSRSRPAYRDRFELGDIYFEDHQDAEDVLDELGSRLEDYDQVSVADYFDLAGVDGATWAHDKFGWRSLKNARLTYTRHGYAIILPEPIELE